MALWFELHLTGIETKKRVFDVKPLTTFELHLTGIETTKIQIFRRRNIVRIAPYWNWNIIRSFYTIIQKRFELHLTGIETVCEWKQQNTELRSNCTLLELKHRYPTLSTVYPYVRIAPYWNWNLYTKVGINEATLFELHLTGIETLIRLILHSSTFVRIAPYWNWNFDIASDNSGEQLVRIAPYWNWNTESERECVRAESSNCTLLELKRASRPECRLIS